MTKGRTNKGEGTKARKLKEIRKEKEKETETKRRQKRDKEATKRKEGKPIRDKMARRQERAREGGENKRRGNTK